MPHRHHPTNQRINRPENAEALEALRKIPILQNIFSTQQTPQSKFAEALGFMMHSRFHNLAEEEGAPKYREKAQKANESEDVNAAEHNRSTHSLESPQQISEKNRRYALSLATLANKPSKRLPIVQEGAIQILIELSALHDRSIQVRCASAFASLSLDPTVRVKMLDDGAMPAILALSANSNLREVKVDCSRAICNLACVPHYEYKLLKESVPFAVVAIAAACPETYETCLKVLLNISCVSEKSPRIEEVTEALTHFANIPLPFHLELLLLQAFVNLSALRNNQLRLVEDGLFPILAKYYRSRHLELRRMSCEILKNLTVDYRSRAKLIEMSAVLGTILEMANDVDEEIRMQAAKCFLFLSKDRNFRKKITNSRALELIMRTCRIANLKVDIAQVVTKTLRILCTDSELMEQLVRDNVGLSIKNLMTLGDRQISQHCLESLCSLFQNEKALRQLVVEEEIHEDIVRLVNTTLAQQREQRREQERQEKEEERQQQQQQEADNAQNKTSLRGNNANNAANGKIHRTSSNVPQGLHVEAQAEHVPPLQASLSAALSVSHSLAGTPRSQSGINRTPSHNNVNHLSPSPHNTHTPTAHTSHTAHMHSPPSRSLSQNELYAQRFEEWASYALFLVAASHLCERRTTETLLLPCLLALCGDEGESESESEQKEEQEEKGRKIQERAGEKKEESKGEEGKADGSEGGKRAGEEEKVEEKKVERSNSGESLEESENEYSLSFNSSVLKEGTESVVSAPSHADNRSHASTPVKPAAHTETVAPAQTEESSLSQPAEPSESPAQDMTCTRKRITLTTSLLTMSFCAAAIAVCSASPTPSSPSHTTQHNNSRNVVVDCSPAIPLLVEMLQVLRNTEEGPESEIQKYCALALFHLSKKEENCDRIFACEALSPIVSLTQSLETKVICAGIISRLSLHPQYYKHFATGNVLQMLLELSCVDDRLTQRRVVIALSNLSQDAELRRRLLALNPISYIVSLAAERDEYLRRGCISIVCNISFQQGSERGMVRAGIIPTLMITSLITTDQVISRIICVKALLNLMADASLYAEMMRDGVLWALSKLGLMRESRELQRLCAIALCRLSRDHSRSLLQTSLAVQAVLHFLQNAEDYAMQQAGARALTNLLLETTTSEGDESFRAAAVRAMRPIAQSDDGELNELCVICLCLASQSESCRSAIVSSDMLQMIDPATIFRADQTIAFAYLSMFSNIAHDPQMRKQVVDDQLVNRLERILINRDPLLISAAVKALYCVSCARENLPKLVQQHVIEFIHHIVELHVAEEDLDMREEFGEEDEERESAYESDGSRPSSACFSQYTSRAASRVSCYSAASDGPGHTQTSPALTFDAPTLQHLLGCIFNLCTHEDVAQTLVSEGIVRVLARLWRTQRTLQEDLRLARLAILSVCNLACARTNSKQMVSDGCTPLLCFVARSQSHTQRGSGSSSAGQTTGVVSRLRGTTQLRDTRYTTQNSDGGGGNSSNSSAGGNNNNNSNAFTAEVFVRVSAALRNLLSVVSNQQTMVRQGALTALMYLANLTLPRAPHTLNTSAAVLAQQLANNNSSNNLGGNTVNNNNISSNAMLLGDNASCDVSGNGSAASHFVLSTHTQQSQPNLFSSSVSQNTYTQQQQQQSSSQTQSAVSPRTLRSNCAAALKSLTYNHSLRHALLETDAISIILAAMKRETDLTISHELLKELEAESWDNGARGRAKEGRARPLPPSSVCTDWLRGATNVQLRVTKKDVELRKYHVQVQLDEDQETTKNKNSSNNATAGANNNANNNYDNNDGNNNNSPPLSLLARSTSSMNLHFARESSDLSGHYNNHTQAQGQGQGQGHNAQQTHAQRGGKNVPPPPAEDSPSAFKQSASFRRHKLQRLHTQVSLVTLAEEETSLPPHLLHTTSREALSSAGGGLAQPQTNTHTQTQTSTSTNSVDFASLSIDMLSPVEENDEALGLHPMTYAKQEVEVHVDTVFLIRLDNIDYNNNVNNNTNSGNNNNNTNNNGNNNNTNNNNLHDLRAYSEDLADVESHGMNLTPRTMASNSRRASFAQPVVAAGAGKEISRVLSQGTIHGSSGKDFFVANNNGSNGNTNRDREAQMFLSRQSTPPNASLTRQSSGKESIAPPPPLESITIPDISQHLRRRPQQQQQQQHLAQSQSQSHVGFTHSNVFSLNSSLPSLSSPLLTITNNNTGTGKKTMRTTATPVARRPDTDETMASIVATIKKARELKDANKIDDALEKWKSISRF